LSFPIPHGRIARPTKLVNPPASIPSTLTSDQFVAAVTSLQRSGRWAEAEALCRQVLAGQPCQPDALHLLGLTAQNAGQPRAAIELISAAIAARPDVAAYHNNLGEVYRSIQDTARAIPCYLRALQLKPDHAEAYCNLGSAYGEQDDLERAQACFAAALQLKPTLAGAYLNLANIRGKQRDFDGAIQLFRKAIELDPEFATAHFNLAWYLLVTGHYAEGWREYEWRLRQNPSFSPPQPRWDGSPLNGRTLLLHSEQGFGDTIQFARYIPLAAQRTSLATDPHAGRIVLVCPQPLLPLLSRLAHIAETIPLAENLAPPPFDVHCPLPSMPLLFGTELDTIPSDVPYLTPDAAAVEQWARRLATAASTIPNPLRVGLAWAGNPTAYNDRNRSCRLADLTPLAGTAGVEFHSLQKGEGERQADNPPPGMMLFRWADHLQDFGDTAALIANLDLVICIDSAVAHLAGAMGKPTWTLPPYDADWRYMLERDTSPWYPTMRLFRQLRRRDWAGVAQRVREELERVVKQRM
jgi:tetratricopeptide (TPR) repeat protein